MSPDDHRRARWRGLLAEQKTSGLSFAAFCRDCGLSIKTFGYWRKRNLAEEAQSATGWLAVIPEKPPASRPLIAEPNRSLTVNIGIVSFDLRSGFDPGLLREVVSWGTACAG
jgi:hypothetical protein